LVFAPLPEVSSVNVSVPATMPKVMENLGIIAGAVMRK
jgi:hypothetical protein